MEFTFSTVENWIIDIKKTLLAFAWSICHLMFCPKFKSVAHKPDFKLITVKSACFLYLETQVIKQSLPCKTRNGQFCFLCLHQMCKTSLCQMEVVSSILFFILEFNEVRRNITTQGKNICIYHLIVLVIPLDIQHCSWIVAELHLFVKQNPSFVGEIYPNLTEILTKSKCLLAVNFPPLFSLNLY